MNFKSKHKNLLPFKANGKIEHKIRELRKTILLPNMK